MGGEGGLKSHPSIWLSMASLIPKENLLHCPISLQDGFVTWNEYKSEEFDLDDNEDENTLASDPERIEVE